MTYALEAGRLGFGDLAANGLVNAAQPSQVDDLADEVQGRLSRSPGEPHPTCLRQLRAPQEQLWKAHLGLQSLDLSDSWMNLR